MARQIAPPETGGRRESSPTKSGPAPWLMGAAAVLGVVLRWWNLGGTGLSGDEMFTGSYADMPISDIPGWVARHDVHPPLDHLIRHWFADARSTFLLRFPSAVFATLTVILVWWWMRKRGWFGFAVILLTSLSSFELLYGRQARHYSLLILVGTVVAVLADKWMERPRTSLSVLCFLTLCVGLFTDETAGMLVAGVIALPLLRRDRDAWLWRASAVVPVVVWLAVWGPNVPYQYSLGWTNYIELVTPLSAPPELGRLVFLFYPILAWLAVPMVAFGCWALWKQERRLAIVVTALALFPLALALLLGIRMHILLVRSLSCLAWFVPVALAAGLEWCRLRNRQVLILAAVVLAVIGIPSASLALNYEEDLWRTANTIKTVVHPGDAVVSGQVLDSGRLFNWTLDTSIEKEPIPGYDDPRIMYASIVPGAPFTGKVWVVSSRGASYAPPGLAKCPAPDPAGDEELAVECWQIPPG